MGRKQSAVREEVPGPQGSGMRVTQPIIGARVRELRKARSMTLQDLAEETGLSAGYLSQLERDRATPSIRALKVISQSLGVTIGWFFPDPETDGKPEAAFIVRADRRRALRFASGIRDELLCPSLAGRLELLLCSFEPAASSGDELYSHDGEEAGYVAEGQLELTIGRETFLLNKGDSFHFESTRPHRYRNPGPSETLVVWAMTPPHY